MITAISHILLVLMFYVGGCDIKSKEVCNTTWQSFFVLDKNVSGYPKHIHLDATSDWYYLGLYVVISKLTTNGLDCERDVKSTYEYIVFITISFCCVFLYILIIITPIISAIVFDRQVMFEYAHVLKVILMYLKEQKVNPIIISKVKKFYELFWVRSRGMRGLNIPDWLLIPVAKRIVCLDVYWKAYQHSHMFRDVDIPFLRYLSQFFTSEYYMPGDIIYKTLDLKTKMIYVVGGVIQQTSEFDSQRVCLTGNFPWILKPESPFLKVWDRIILCDILITTAIIPYNAVYLMNMTIAAVVLMFSSLYICDIYIQMTTAFLTRDV
ncbi:hypothetical protein C0J52_15296 [Blattella germanica]|nr:hypothetical protein C0J52_15296 [Blattella germanica]